MLLDPNQLDSVSSSRILTEVIHGRLDIDHRVLRALLPRREETVVALLEVAKSDVWRSSVDLQTDLVNFFWALEAAEGIPYLIDALGFDVHDVPDEITEALYFFGESSVEPLLKLYRDVQPEDKEPVAFQLSLLSIKDDRIFSLLLEQLKTDPKDGAQLLGNYGDERGRQPLEELRASLTHGDERLSQYIDEALQLISEKAHETRESNPLDIYSVYPEETELPLDLLPEEERLELLDDSRAAIRAEVAHSFFNQHPGAKITDKLLVLAKSDTEVTVRSNAWEALVDATEKPGVVELMLERLRNEDTPIDERASLLVGLSVEADRNEVRHYMDEFYDRQPSIRAKVLEAMWRSLHSSFRDKFAKHLDDTDPEVRRSAVWGVGYFAVRPALDKLRSLFDDEHLRSDAIFAYGLALPTEISKGRVKALLKRIEKDAGGLTDMEERLAMTALDERLMLAGKEPVFFPED